MKNKYGISLPIMLAVFLLSPLFSLTQEIPVFFKGHVFDASDGKALPLVHLRLKKNNYVAVTGTDGEYSVFALEPPDTLVITCIGYETRRIRVDGNMPKVFDIKLVSKVFPLNEVTVKAEKIQAIFKDDVYSVLDYELSGDLIYLLIFRDRLKRSELLLLDQDGDTISRNQSLPGKPQAIVKSCLDDIHLVTKDSAYVVVRKNYTLELENPMSAGFFNYAFSSCITNIGRHIFAMRKSLYNLQVDFYSIDLNTGKSRIVCNIIDKFKLNMLRKNKDDMLLMWATTYRTESLETPIRVSDLNGNTEFPNLRVRDERDREVDHHFNKIAYYAPVMAQLKRIDNYVAVFDFPESAIRYFTEEGDHLFNVPITFHQVKNDQKILSSVFLDKTWEEYEVLVDEKQLRAFALEMESGVCKLMEIDLRSGDIINTFYLNYPFPEKVRVHGGYAYYLYKGYRDRENKKLFKQGMY
ncbi:MAG: carboxypeptidase-like regulatory domain-containing protein [Bacteroidetes bacterium]|nr:carboxypeptidase-like regulatory domain-containing protein [Bacteroidota bacterium]